MITCQNSVECKIVDHIKKTSLQPVLRKQTLDLQSTAIPHNVLLAISLLLDMIQ